MKIDDLAREIQSKDIGPSAPDWIDNLLGPLNRWFDRGATILSSISLTDNIRCQVITATFNHGVPVALKPRFKPGGMMVLSASGQIVAGSYLRVLSAAQALATVVFADVTATKVNVTVVLWPEGSADGNAPSAPVWTPVSAFLNGWSNLGGFAYPVGYRKDQSGYVHLRGAMKSGAIASTAFTLPAGYRPAAGFIARFAVPSNGGFGEAWVQDIGSVVPNVGSNVGFWLDGITFLAEQ